MKNTSSNGLRTFQWNIQGYGSNSYNIERIAALEKALARRPRQFQLDLVGNGEIAADWALLIRSVLLQRPARTRLTTHARSSLQGGSVLVWLMGERRLIRDDARLFLRRVDMTEANEADPNEVWKESDVKYLDSFSEADPDDSDYVRMLRLIDEFLPVRELAGKVINLPVLRQFGLVDNDSFDRFLASAFRQPEKPEAKPAPEPRPKRARAHAKVAKAE